MPPPLHCDTLYLLYTRPLPTILEPHALPALIHKYLCIFSQAPASRHIKFNTLCNCHSQCNCQCNCGATAGQHDLTQNKEQNYLPQVATAIEKKPENGSHKEESNKHQNKTNNNLRIRYFENIILLQRFWIFNLLNRVIPLHME